MTEPGKQQHLLYHWSSCCSLWSCWQLLQLLLQLSCKPLHEHHTLLLRILLQLC
jgi:hypothetical protein